MTRVIGILEITNHEEMARARFHVLPGEFPLNQRVRVAAGRFLPPAADRPHSCAGVVIGYNVKTRAFFDPEIVEYRVRMDDSGETWLAVPQEVWQDSRAPAPAPRTFRRA